MRCCPITSGIGCRRWSPSWATTRRSGFHGHQNLSLGVANSIVAYENGARQIDGTLCALGAGAGNSPTEILATTFELLDVPTGVDVDLALAAAEEVLKPMITRMPVADRASIVQGRFGVYNSFLLHAERAADRYGVSAHEILRRVGEAGYVGGQEDMIIDVAIDLAKASSQARRPRWPYRSPALYRPDRNLAPVERRSAN